MRELGERVRPMIVCAVTLLPEPDSPTIASTSPALELEGDAVDRLQRPSSVAKPTRRSSTSSSGRAGAQLAPAGPQPDPRIEVGVGDVDQGVEEDDEEGAEEGHRHDRGEVEVPGRFGGVLADAVRG